MDALPRMVGIVLLRVRGRGDPRLLRGATSDAQERIYRARPCPQNLKLELIHVFLGEYRWWTEEENFCGRIILHRL
jgi:hypothetical protein